MMCCVVRGWSAWSVVREFPERWYELGGLWGLLERRPWSAWSEVREIPKRRYEILLACIVHGLPPRGPRGPRDPRVKTVHHHRHHRHHPLLAKTFVLLMGSLVVLKGYSCHVGLRIYRE